MSANNVNIGANSIQLLGKPSGIVDAITGRIKANLSIEVGPGGQRINVDAARFPFLKPEEPCFVILAVFQVNPVEPAIVAPSSKLIIPG